MSTIYASFIDPSAAERAAGALLDRGARSDQISVLVREGAGYSRSVSTEASAEKGISTTTAADAGAGAIKGGVMGAGAGTLAVLASLFIPGIGFVLGGGALAMALAGGAGAIAAGAAAGGVVGYLKDQGVNEDLAATYSNDLASGGAVLAVTVAPESIAGEETETILVKYGALNVSTIGPGVTTSVPDVRDPSAMTFTKPSIVTEGNAASDVWVDPNASAMHDRALVEDDLAETDNIPPSVTVMPPVVGASAIEEDLNLRHPLPNAYADNPDPDKLD